jgi:hypothetical protein
MVWRRTQRNTYSGGVIAEFATQLDRLRRGVYKPFRSHCNIDGLVSQGVLQILGIPRLGGRPGGGGIPHHEGSIPGDISHEFEWAGLFIQLLDDRAIQLIVSRD